MEMSQTNTLTHGQIIEMSNSTKSNTQITAEIMQTYDLLKFALAWSNGSSFLLITQYEFTGKNNGFPILDILGYLKNTHKNPKFEKVRQIPIREFPTKFPNWDLSHSLKFGIFVGIL